MAENDNFRLQSMSVFLFSFITVVITWNAPTWSFGLVLQLPVGFYFTVHHDVHVTLNAHVIIYNNKNCIIASRIIPHSNMNSVIKHVIVYCNILCNLLYRNACTITISVTACFSHPDSYNKYYTILCKCTVMWTHFKLIFKYKIYTCPSFSLQWKWILRWCAYIGSKRGQFWEDLKCDNFINFLLKCVYYWNCKAA